METSNDELKLIQEKGLGLLHEFLRIAEKHQLTYYIIGGTLLGAVRHKGFIPWDDDIDIAMPREDYNRFITLSSSEYRSPFRLVTDQTDETYRRVYACLQDSSTQIKLTHGNKEVIFSLWLDILPIDGMPEKGWSRFIHEKLYLFTRMMVHLSNFDRQVDQNRKNRSLLEKTVIGFANKTKIERWIDYKFWSKCYNRILTKYDMTAFYSGSLPGAYKLGELVPSRLWGAGCQIEFEGLLVNAPEHYSEYLATIYGSDYLTPPPAEKRIPHQYEVLSFGDKIGKY